MDRSTNVYPDISDLLALKAEGRRIRSRVSFAEKIAWVESARRDLARIGRGHLRQTEPALSGVPSRKA